MGYTQDRWRARKARRYDRERPGPAFVWSRLFVGEAPSLATIKQKLLYRSMNVFSHGGGKGYKRRYHRRWRQQGREQEHSALSGDEGRFESIAPDAKRGAIAWDGW